MEIQQSCLVLKLDIPQGSSKIKLKFSKYIFKISLRNMFHFEIKIKDQHINVPLFSNMVSRLETHGSQMLSSHGISHSKASFILDV
jgi:hypothetical protein